MPTKLPVFFLIAAFSSLASAADPCAYEMSARLRSASNAQDWTCMRYQAAHGDAFEQYYVGVVLVSGKGLEGKKIAEGVLLLEAAARSKDPRAAAAATAALHQLCAGDDCVVR